ncbi:MAG TPA: DUF488 family protein, partial [Actinomycetota bacterium]
MTSKPEVRVRRVYDEPSGEDGTRVLVDRVWPRGLSKQNAQVDQWRKEVAPSTELRKWYGHDPARFAEFTRRYWSELQQPEQAEVVGVAEQPFEQAMGAVGLAGQREVV